MLFYVVISLFLSALTLALPSPKPQEVPQVQPIDWITQVERLRKIVNLGSHSIHTRNESPSYESTKGPSRLDKTVQASSSDNSNRLDSSYESKYVNSGRSRSSKIVKRNKVDKLRLTYPFMLPNDKMAL